MEDKSIAEQVVQYIIKIPHDEFSSLSVCKLARELGIDRTRMSKQFKQERNVKLEDFLFQQRMGRAAVLLTSRKGITVKEVSEAVGFTTCDYFIKRFKEYFGIVPGKFRQLRKRRDKRGDRRSMKGDRRKRSDKNKVKETGERRQGVSERREGPKDRRKIEPEAPKCPVEEKKTNGNCDTCKFKMAYQNGEIPVKKKNNSKK